MPDIGRDERQVIRDLQTVRTHGEFPKGRNYLYSRYKHEGYVYMGNKLKRREGGRTTEYLTPQSKVKLTKKGYDVVKLAKKHNDFMGSI